jgi:curved DNA-binding protein CbpA
LAKFKDYYQVLGIEPRVHFRVIEESYWESAHALKKQPTRAAAKKLRALNEAYEVLGSPHRRMAYDRQFAVESKQRPSDQRPGAFQQLFGMLARPFRLS